MNGSLGPCAIALMTSQCHNVIVCDIRINYSEVNLVSRISYGVQSRHIEQNIFNELILQPWFKKIWGVEIFIDIYI